MKIDNILTQEQEKAGLRLQEGDDGTVCLLMYLGDTFVAYKLIGWFIPDTKPEYIRATADFYLVKEGLKK